MAKHTLAQIFAALAATGETGAQMMADLQDEIQNLRTEAANHRTTKQKILSNLGIQDGNDVDTALNGITQTLAALKSTGAKPDEIGRQLAELGTQVKKLTDDLAAEKTGRQQERDKRIGATKLSAALAALQKGNAANPEVLAKIVLDNVVTKDDDSLVYKTADGKEIAVEEGVGSWLAANPWAVKNTQAGGAGSGAGGGSGSGGAEDLDKLTPAEYIKAREAQKK